MSSNRAEWAGESALFAPSLRMLGSFLLAVAAAYYRIAYSAFVAVAFALPLALVGYVSIPDLPSASGYAVVFHFLVEVAHAKSVSARFLNPSPVSRWGVVAFFL